MPRITTRSRSVIPQDQRELREIAYDVVEFVLAGWEGNASATAPIGETGNLAASIDHDTRRIPDGAEGEGRAGAEYAGYVNYGTGRAGAGSSVPNRGPEIGYSAGWAGMPAQPFASQAAVTAEKEWDAAWRKIERRLPRL